ncbi:hypothetical protein [Paludisphaera rhizosphaerae]|uniref:hypothetical protein n=1 Tax=Paludisphaera rhizosphaerae TaxID=2711216 RepID=UPI0013EB0983|nr:hypothetical protein [Paludisphaera rhizosphaerae]
MLATRSEHGGLDMNGIQPLLRRSAILLLTPILIGLAARPTAGQTETTTPAPRPPDLKPMADGPLHEAFLSVRRDLEPAVLAQSPPPPIVERPGPEPPRSDARWIEGYWEWSPDRSKFVWVTGTWRVPPPGRFWVNTLWKRNENGWRRFPGFWSDRATDKLAYGADGPPKDRPIDDSGAPPKSNCFYIPGQFVVDGDRIAWRKGFWADAKPGWAWTPATWTRQPEGWIFQEGYWDYPLEERGILFAPAEIAREVRPGEVLTYHPYTMVSPELYGQLYGAFGRSTPYYDGYPGVAYDEGGRYYAFADYGNLSPYYGYLDYPAVGGFGYPYYVAPIDYTYRQLLPAYGGAPSPLVYGFGLPYYGFGNSILPLMAGYPLFGNPGLSNIAWGWGYPGWGAGGLGWGNIGWSGVALGTWPGFNWGVPGWSGPAIGAFPAFGLNIGFPNWWSGWGGWGLGGPGFGWGWNGLGLGGLGLGFGFGFPGLVWGGNSSVWSNNYPFPNSGRHQGQGPNMNSPTTGAASGNLVNNGSMRQGAASLVAHHLGGAQIGVQPPPASRPFAALVDRGASSGGLTQHNPGFHGSMRTASAAGVDPSPTWSHSFNGVSPTSNLRHEVARPTFTNNAANPGAAGFNPQMRGPGNAVVHPGAIANTIPGVGDQPAWNSGMRAGGLTGIGGTPAFAPQLHSAPAAVNGGNLTGFTPPNHTGNAVGNVGGMRGSDFAGGGAIGSGFTGGVRQPGGFTNMPSFGAGVYNNGGMGSAFSGGMRTADGVGAMHSGASLGPNLGGSGFSGFGGARAGSLGTGFGAGGAVGGFNGGGVGGHVGGGGMGIGAGSGHMR